MLKTFIFLKVALIIVFLATPQAYAVKDCKNLGNKLLKCEEFECITKSEALDNALITNKVLGFENDLCVHEQINPNGEKVVCRYSDESRKFIGLRINKYISNKSSMQQGKAFEENILADIFHNECEVISAEKDDKPVISGNEDFKSLDVDYNELQDQISYEKFEEVKDDLQSGKRIYMDNKERGAAPEIINTDDKENLLEL